MKTNKKLERYVNDDLSEYVNEAFLKKLKSSVPEKGTKQRRNGRKVVFACVSVAVIIVSICLGVFLGRPWNTDRGDTPIEKQKVDYNVAFAQGYDKGALAFGAQYAETTLESDLKVKIDTMDELIAISNENEFPFFDKKAEGYNSPLGKKIRSYDEEFFADKSLILVFRWGIQGIYERLVDLYASGDSYVVTLSTLFYDEGDGFGWDNSTHSFANIIEIEKNAKINASKIDVKTVSYGKLYLTLTVTLEMGIISKEDVRSIVYYYNNGKEYVDGKLTETGYTPIPLEPTELSEDTLYAIKNSLVDYLFYSGLPLGEKPQKTLMDASVKYLGTYNGYIAVDFSNSGLSLMGWIPGEEIAGCKYVTNELPIFLWKAP